jgi:hypothetical protein
MKSFLQITVIAVVSCLIGKYLGNKITKILISKYKNSHIRRSIINEV